MTVNFWVHLFSSLYMMLGHNKTFIQSNFTQNCSWSNNSLSYIWLTGLSLKMAFVSKRTFEGIKYTSRFLKFGKKVQLIPQETLPLWIRCEFPQFSGRVWRWHRGWKCRGLWQERGHKCWRHGWCRPTRRRPGSISSCCTSQTWRVWKQRTLLMQECHF